MALHFGSVLCGFTILLACLPGVAFQGPSIESPAPVSRRSGDLPIAALRASVSVVLIPAHVTNGLGRSVTDLQQADFLLFDNGAEQTITQLLHEDAPISVGLLFDTSGSMQKKLPRAIEAIGNFINTANPEDEFFLIQFGERAKLAVPFTGNSNEILHAVQRTRAFGRTSLLDAIQMALTQMKSARHLRKALVILSDGGDNRSRHTAAAVRNGLLESDVQIYAMGVFDERDTGKLTPEERNGPGLLGDLTELSGGHLYQVDNAEALPEISTKISRALRDQYVFGYSPSGPLLDGKYHRVQLRMASTVGFSSDLRLNYRRGYFAPNE